MLPHAIAVASSKGGTGKSSIAAALAVQAVADGRKVALLDWEPQGSLTLWWTMRGKPTNPRLISNTDDPEQAVRIAGEHQCEWLILDTAPADIDQIERAVMACDVCLIPVSASAFDLIAARTVVALCGQHERRFAFVLNRENPGRETLNGSAARHLRKLGVLLSEHVQDRAAYVSALNKGLTGPEHPDSRQAKGARQKVEALWTAVKGLIAKGKAR
jgi:chromosome partitioning protein